MEPCLASPASRREQRRLERRDAILDVAQQLFLDSGYAATSMSAIAAALGGSKGTLWSYFPSKEELFSAMIERATGDFQQELSSILKGSASVEAGLTGFCRQFLRKITMPDAIGLHRLVAGEAGRFPELGRIFFERAAGRTRDRLAAFIAEAMERGELRRDDPDAAAKQLTGLCLAGCHMDLILGVLPGVAPALIDSEVERSVGTFLRAYRP